MKKIEKTITEHVKESKPERKFTATYTEAELNRLTQILNIAAEKAGNLTNTIDPDSRILLSKFKENK